MITGFCYTLNEKSIRQKLIVFFKTVVSLMLVFGLLISINEFFIKSILKAKRPSHVYILKQVNTGDSIENVYQMSKEERKEYFSKLIKNNSEKFKNINPTIQNHWIKEAGYSFPSGHSFNAFLFAMITAYTIYFNTNYIRLRKLYFIPFLWALIIAVSRVAMGVHTPLDVSFGAALGILIGFFLLYINFTRHWLTRKP